MSVGSRQPVADPASREHSTDLGSIDHFWNTF
jgi:hypothetical protein